MIYFPESSYWAFSFLGKPIFCNYGLSDMNSEPRHKISEKNCTTARILGKTCIYRGSQREVPSLELHGNCTEGTRKNLSFVTTSPLCAVDKIAVFRVGCV